LLLASTGRLQWAGNVAAGILGALIWIANPLALPLLLVPIALTSPAYRDWLRILQERDWMARMSQAADTIVTSGDLTKRIDPVGAPGEDGAVAHLGLTLNRMLSRLETSVTRERTFIRQSSHDLRTPITICRGHLEVLSPEPSSAELDETRELVLDELARMARIVDDMEDLAFMEDPASLRRSTVELDRFVSELTAKAGPLLGSRLRAQPDVPRDELRADPQRLTQALINLLRNAREHTPAETPIDLRVVRDNGSWRFEVADHGGGLAAEHEARAFEPFFKREHSAGSGLGLAIVSGIARAHGGTAGLDNREGEGATFWVRIPR
jgi:signal transduction histidine kinase